METGSCKEDYAIVLDFLPNGYPFDPRPSHRKLPIAQALGKTCFVLRELVPKKGIFLNPGDQVYIGEGKRENIHHIAGRLSYEKLTSTARSQLEYIVKDLVQSDQSRFVNFFNKAMPLTTRMHQLELLPGVGKKHMWEVIRERDIEPFKDFNDLQKRVKLLPDPQKIVVKRIISELLGMEKYLLFVGR